ncbi:MAG: hypothetical protein JSV42_07205 [Chloroflexota bacterium]|nr:MAG: hypothetical protein JSV42_07205 [Chloroflexota bacterium]
MIPPSISRTNLWFPVWKLLRLRGVIFISSFRRARLRNKIGIILLGIIFLAVLIAAFVISLLILNALRSPQIANLIQDPDRLLANIPILVVTLVFLIILITSFGLLLQALYLAGDMDFLLSSPLPIRAVFLSKLLQAILPNYAFVLLFGLPVLFGLGISQEYHLIYYPLVILVLSLFAITAAGISSLIVMVVVRVFPARRVAEVLGFFVAVTSFLCSQSGQLARFSEISGPQASQALNQLEPLYSPLSPLTWAGGSLAAIGQGQWLPGFGYLLLTLILCGGIFALSLITSERLYFSGWASVQSSNRRAKKIRRQSSRSSTRPDITRAISHLVPSPVQGILVKDLLVTRRDLRNLSQLITPLILGIFYAVMLIRRGSQPPEGSGEAPAVFMQVLTNLAVYANVGISIFIGWSLLSRLAGMSFSLEGKQYWLLKSAPVSTNRLLGGKFLFAYLPTLLLCWSFLLITSLLQHISSANLIYSLVVVAFTLAGVTGFNLSFGVVGANFDWDDPRRIPLGAIGCLGFFISGICLVIILIFFFGPPILFEIFSLPPIIGYLTGFLIGSTVSLGLVFIPLRFIRQRVPRLAE